MFSGPEKTELLFAGSKFQSHLRNVSTLVTNCWYDFCLQVKGIRWDASLGGQTMEGRLLDHFALEFNKQVGGGFDVRQFPKAMAKLKKQVKRTKEILSANTEAPLSVEAIHDDRDFRCEVNF
jgi:molecular chaperone DnaK (HSP70)